jgi:hypothetical protein
MIRLVSGAPGISITETETQQGEGCFAPSAHGWQAVRLPELAGRGFPFAPTFILHQPRLAAVQNVSVVQQAHNRAGPTGD